MSDGKDESFDLDSEVAFAALGGWEQSLRDALQAYCDHCRRLDARELQRRPSMLLDFNIWADPRGAAHGRPIQGFGSVEAAAAWLASQLRGARSDPYAIIGALARECER
jgi:hypothetical protein